MCTPSTTVTSRLRANQTRAVQPAGGRCHTAAMDLNGWGPLVTIAAALVVIIGMIVTVVVQRRTARQSLEQLRRTAESAALSAATADRSSKSAEEAVGANRETAVGVARRAETDALAQRYQDAAIQLGHDKAAVRLAGVYAMARLADDSPDQRPSCVDVLCAYLRMLTQHDTTQAAEGEKQVRIAILRLIGDHLDASRPDNWCDCDLDFSYSELPMIAWSEPTFKKRPEFSHARFTDAVSVAEPTFEQGVSFTFGRFEGPLRIQGARVASGDVALYGADLTAGVLGTDFLAEGSTIDLSRAVCRGDFSVLCSPVAREPQGRVALREVLVRVGGAFSLEGVDVEGANASATSGPTSGSGAIINVEPDGRVRLPATFKEYSGRDVYNDVWKN